MGNNLTVPDQPMVLSGLVCVMARRFGNQPMSEFSKIHSSLYRTESLMESRITGTTMPVLEIGLEPGETIIAEPGELSWMTPAVQLRTSTATAGARGVWGALKRAAAGGGLFMTEFSAKGGRGLVAFAAKVPGAIVPVQIAPNAGYLVHRHGFLCASQGVQLGIGFQKSLGAGIFGGTGFILQRITGAGTAWVELGGEIISRELAPGEELLVHPGHVGMFEERVGCDVTTIRGISNAVFGGDGLFLMRLTGPGRVWLQTMTMPGLAHGLAPYLSQEATPTTTEAVGGGVAAAVMKGLFGNR
jgi:uncharacterized protein (TIGR00266 family)